MTEYKPSLLKVLQSYGIHPKKTGKSLMVHCPFHEDKTPSLSIDEMKGLFKCFGCNKAGDVFTFVSEKEGLNIKTDFPIIQRIAFEKAGEPMPEKEKKTVQKKAAAPQQSVDLESAHNILMNEERGAPGRGYLEKRGIGRKIWEQFKLGFWPVAGFYQNRIIIPGPGAWFTSRAIGDKLPKARHASGPIPGLLNMDVLNKAESIFLVEGPFDAFTLIQTGWENTVSLFGTETLKEDFLSAFKGKEVNIIFDNDNSGERGREDVQQKLESAGATVIQIYLPGGKDINETYCNNPGEFEKRLSEAISEAAEEREYSLGDLDYLENTFFRRQELPPAIDTGFNKLNEYLGGGFRGGVIMLGAPTSFGKTALAIQWAVKAAQQSRRVLYVDYEIGKPQVWSRIAGHILKTPFSEIVRAADREKYRNDEIINAARYIHVNASAKFEHLLKAAPFYDFMIIDYLQRMPAIETFESRDLRIKTTSLIHHIQADIARAFNIPVLVISSYSRGVGKAEEPGMDYKESGDIEYSAQVTMGLWFPDAFKDENEGDKRRRFNEFNPQNIFLSLYKNTSGVIGRIKLSYNKITGFFDET